MVNFTLVCKSCHSSYRFKCTVSGMLLGFKHFVLVISFTLVYKSCHSLQWFTCTVSGMLLLFKFCLLMISFTVVYKSCLLVLLYLQVKMQFQLL